MSRLFSLAALLLSLLVVSCATSNFGAWEVQGGAEPDATSDAQETQLQKDLDAEVDSLTADLAGLTAEIDEVLNYQDVPDSEPPPQSPVTGWVNPEPGDLPGAESAPRAAAEPVPQNTPPFAPDNPDLVIVPVESDPEPPPAPEPVAVEPTPPLAVASAPPTPVPAPAPPTTVPAPVPAPPATAPTTPAPASPSAVTPTPPVATPTPPAPAVAPTPPVPTPEPEPTPDLEPKPKLPTPKPPILQEPLGAPTRHMSAGLNQKVEVVLPGLGWVYLGERASSSLLAYEGREQTGTGAAGSSYRTVFTLHTRNPGRTVVQFYKHDPLSSGPRNELVDFTVME